MLRSLSLIIALVAGLLLHAQSQQTIIPINFDSIQHHLDSVQASFQAWEDSIPIRKAIHEEQIEQQLQELSYVQDLFPWGFLFPLALYVLLRFKQSSLPEIMQGRDWLTIMATMVIVYWYGVAMHLYMTNQGHRFWELHVIGDSVTLAFVGLLTWGLCQVVEAVALWVRNMLSKR